MTPAKKFEVVCADRTVHYGPDAGHGSPGVEAALWRAKQLNGLGLHCGLHTVREAVTA